MFQHDDLGDDEHGEPIGYGLSRVLSEVIGTFLHLLFTPCNLGESITEVQLKLVLDLTQLVLDSTCPVLHKDDPLVLFLLLLDTWPPALTLASSS